MSTQTQMAPIVETSSQWRWSTRMAFRFCFVYFLLFVLTTQIIGGLFPIPKLDIPALAAIPPVRPVVLWTATHVFRVNPPPIFDETGSGDRTVDWVLSFCTLVAAAAAMAIWGILDRRRGNYATAYKWFRLFVRFSLACQMFAYGMAKVVPLQMPFPYLARLLEPFGNFSPMGVLWSSVGASPAYEMFTGSAEMLGGLLLIFPRTTILGALISLADLVEIFLLNMTYDVPVKLFSFHLILLAVFLLAPDLRRLADFFFLHREARISGEPPLFRTRRSNRIALAAQKVVGSGLFATNAYGAREAWHTYGPGRAKSPLYGIWNVEEMLVDGQARRPLVTDKERWRRAIFDSPESMALGRMDDTYAYFAAAINANTKTIVLTKRTDKKWKAALTFAQPSKDRLTLDGAMDGHQIQVQLRLLDTSRMMLLSRGFHWVSEFPFNR